MAKRLTAQEKLEAGKVPAYVRAQVSEKELNHWYSLSGGQRLTYYDSSLYEHRRAHAMENGFLWNGLGQGTASGRGGVFVAAIRQAYIRSDEYRAEQEAWRQAQLNAPRVCNWCEVEKPGSEVSGYGDVHICHQCWWEKDPASAEKFRIPKRGVPGAEILEEVTA